MHVPRSVAIVDVAEAESTCGVVVAIDVIRAFSVAAYALARGARRLILVREIDEALRLREIEPDVLLAGEVHGRLIPGFDLDNSPAHMQAAAVRDRVVIQRTGAGTQAAVRSIGATRLLVASLVVAEVFATGIGEFPPEDVPAFLAVNHFSFAMEGRRRTVSDVTCVAVVRHKV